MKNRVINISYIVLQSLLGISAVFFLIMHFFGFKSFGIFDDSLHNFLRCTYCLAYSFLPVLLKKFKINISKVLSLYFVIAVMFHYIGGGTLGFYKSLTYSFAIHGLNSAIIGLIVYDLLAKHCQNTSKFFLAFMTLSCVLAIGAFWEIVEYFNDSVFGWNMQKAINPKTLEPFVGKGAVFDTMNDLVMDFLGGLLGGILAPKIIIKGQPIHTYFAIDHTSKNMTSQLTIDNKLLEAEKPVKNKTKNVIEPTATDKNENSEI